MHTYWMKRLIGGLFLMALFGSLQAQSGELSEASRERIHELEDTLSVLGFTVINNEEAEERFLACRTLITTLVKALKEDHSFDYPFDRLKNVSIQYPQDSTFRIFTWQLYVDQKDYRYYGAIQMNTPELQLFPLVDRSFEVEKVEQEVLSPDKWYGSVYYNIKKVEGPEAPFYLLFGFDGYEFFRKRKVLDVLTFNEDGTPEFGAPVFHVEEPGKTPVTKNRICLEYSSEAAIRLNYDAALDLIVFDHLITMGGQHGEGPVNYPDGSYEGFRIENGRLHYVPKVWDQVQEDAPRPLPILDGKKRDILGNGGR